MRKIERLMNQAITEGRNWKSGNTEVITLYPAGVQTSWVYLHGNHIATITDGSVKLYDGGHQSATTKSRLNAIMSEHCLPGEGVFQKNWEWFCRLWNGTEHFTVPFRSGMRLA